jgi:hypothetical protein
VAWSPVKEEQLAVNTPVRNENEQTQKSEIFIAHVRQLDEIYTSVFSSTFPVSKRTNKIKHHTTFDAHSKIRSPPYQNANTSWQLM